MKELKLEGTSKREKTRHISTTNTWDARKKKEEKTGSHSQYNDMLYMGMNMKV